MALLTTYAIKDNQTPCFPTLFFAISDAVATRTCASLLADDTQISMFPEHFDLYKINQVDQDSGKTVPLQPEGPTFLCGLVTIRDLIKREQNPVRVTSPAEMQKKGEKKQ